MPGNCDAIFEQLQPDANGVISRELWTSAEAAEKLLGDEPKQFNFPACDDIVKNEAILRNPAESPFVGAKRIMDECMQHCDEWRKASSLQDGLQEEWAQGIEMGMYCIHCKKWHRGSRRWHCNRCNKCSADFDHHCIYLNQCICGQNYVPFWWLLCFFLTMMGSALAASIYCLWTVHRCLDIPVFTLSLNPES